MPKYLLKIVVCLACLTSARAASFVDLTYSTAEIPWFTLVEGRWDYVPAICISASEPTALHLEDGVEALATLGRISWFSGRGEGYGSYYFSMDRELSVQLGAETSVQTINQTGNIGVGPLTGIGWAAGSPMLFNFPGVGQITITPLSGAPPIRSGGGVIITRDLYATFLFAAATPESPSYYLGAFVLLPLFFKRILTLLDRKKRQ